MDRIVIVTKPTRLDALILQHLTEGAAAFSLESEGQSIQPYRREDATYKAALAEVRRQLPNDMPVTTVTREDLPNFLFRAKDLIVVCGPDGLFVNLAQYVGSQPVVTVNPDPATVAGILMLFSPHDVGEVIVKVQSGKHVVEALPFIMATVGDRVIYAVNDLFIGRKDHVSARYEMVCGGMSEHQSSSGIIVSTGLGSTGWIRSIVTMISGLTRENVPNKLSSLPEPTDEELVFVVREPFSSPSMGVTLITGRVLPGKPLFVCSEMPDGGFIFSDGVVEKAVPWNAGSKVVVTVGDRYIQRVVG